MNTVGSSRVVDKKSCPRSDPDDSLLRRDAGRGNARFSGSFTTFYRMIK
jgi:hypothetical protein